MIFAYMLAKPLLPLPFHFVTLGYFAVTLLAHAHVDDAAIRHCHYDCCAADDYRHYAIRHYDIDIYYYVTMITRLMPPASAITYCHYYAFAAFRCFRHVAFAFAFIIAAFLIFRLFSLAITLSLPLQRFADVISSPLMPLLPLSFRYLRCLRFSLSFFLSSFGRYAGLPLRHCR